MSELTDFKTAVFRVKSLSYDALKSRTYFYPPLGAIYFATHRSLWPPLLRRLLPCTLLSVGVIVPMFLFTYIPQAAVLTLVNGPFGFINAVGLVLSESAVIINAFARAFLLEGALIDVFDATLISEGQESLVRRGREIRAGSKLDGAKKLGKVLTKPLNKFSFSSITKYVVMLPLNLIPIVGTGIFLILQGRRIGPTFHSRYFQLKGFDEQRRKRFIERNKGSYLAFGTASMIMSLIPLASIVFTFTTTVGAALWAVEMERGNTSAPGDTVDTMGRELHTQE